MEQTHINNHTCQVTVIIPVYNAAMYLNECLDSVFSQTIRDLEVVCVDDGSTDDSLQLLRAYAENHNHTQVISCGNQGAAYARNKGIDAAHGDFLFFLDADDALPDQDVLSDLYQAATQNSVSVCGGELRILGGGDLIPDGWSNAGPMFHVEREGLTHFHDYQYGFGWSRFLYNRRFLLQSRLYMEKRSYYEDPIWLVHVLHAAERFWLMKRCTYLYRIGHKNPDLTDDKVHDLLTGMREIMDFAIEHDYPKLYMTEYKKLLQEYRFELFTRINKPGIKMFHDFIAELQKDAWMKDINISDDIIRTLWLEYEQRLTDIGNLQNDVQRLQEDFDRKEAECQALSRTLRQTLDDIYGSLTWRTGKAVLFLPQKIYNIAHPPRDGGQSDA